ncbi:MAG: YezD family protein [Chloroflexi bacterium]|uniref:YezD family protein n=1 Tax=Candidatus Chlorohelix allophototropha TaxID=3003348 RepID=A0A8T7LXD8_9CHLR|nr:YezD family protein [Chloroflexota bacterium]
MNNLNPQEAEVLVQILHSLRQIKYGYIQITIQDARVVQIDRTEKQRINCK